MDRKEKFSFLKRPLLLKLNNKDNQAFQRLPSHKLYVLNYSYIKRRFIEEIENYKTCPELIDINEFSMNYSFGYHFSNNIDNLYSKEAMYIEVKRFLKNLKVKV
ncbi:hypothetical protein ACWGOQ_0000985 [Aquimarina sp. M1]